MTITPLLAYHNVAPDPEGTVFVAGGLCVIRHVLFVNTSAASSNASISIGGQRIVAAEPVAANRRLEQWLARSMGVGEAITALSSVAGALTLLVEGFSYS